MMHALSIPTEWSIFAIVEKRTLAQLLEQRIADLGVSKAEYARSLGLSPSHLNGMLKGEITLPKPEMRRRIANDLGIPSLDIMVMAGEVNADEIPVEGAPRPIFDQHDSRREILHLLTQVRLDDRDFKWLKYNLERLINDQDPSKPDDSD